jgi:aspartyl-tRNA(Asn)/glutamyl-tRNA(Gln) amidotransferase subunit C
VSRITRAEVLHVARLARLTLSEDELAALTGQLDRILDYVAALSDLDTTGVEPTSHAGGAPARMRADAPVGGLAPDDALANAADRKGDFFRVPRILE